MSEIETPEVCENVQKRSLVQCADQGKNPNPNAPGELKPFTTSEIATWSAGIFVKLKGCKTC